MNITNSCLCSLLFIVYWCSLVGEEIPWLKGRLHCKMQTEGTIILYRQWNIQAGPTAARGGLLCFCLYFGTCRLLLFANFGASYIFMVFCYVFSVFALNIVFGYCFFPK